MIAKPVVTIREEDIHQYSTTATWYDILLASKKKAFAGVYGVVVAHRSISIASKTTTEVALMQLAASL